MTNGVHAAHERRGQRSLALVTFVLAAVMAQAQLVFITQQSMRNWYNNRVPGSVDANGYLNTADPGLLDITDTYLSVRGSITQIEGLAYLPNLTELNMYSSDTCGAPYTIDGWPPNLTSLTLDECGVALLPSWPPTLQHLRTNGPYDALPIPLPPDLVSFSLLSNAIMPTPPQLPDDLDSLAIQSCAIQDLGSLPANLRSFFMTHCDSLTDLGSLPANLEDLRVNYCDGLSDLGPLPGSLQSLDIRGCPALVYLGPLPSALGFLDLEDCANLSTLGALPTTLETLYLKDLPALVAVPPYPSGLEGLYLGAGFWEFLTAWPDSMVWAYIYQDWSAEELAGLPHPGLCIPPLSNHVEAFSVHEYPTAPGLPICLPNYPPSLSWAIYETGGTCTFQTYWIDACGAPDPDCLTSSTLVKGVTFNDENGDGLMNGGEPPMPEEIVSVEPGGLLTTSDQLGVFTALPGVGSFTITRVPAMYWTLTTPPQTADLPATGATDSLDAIGAIATPGMYDLRVDIACNGSVPGTVGQCWITVENVGTEPQTGVLSMLVDADQSVAGASPTPLSQNANEVIWDMPVLQVGHEWYAMVDISTGTTVPMNTDVMHTATVGPEFLDLTMVDNTYTWQGVVSNSFDPNDKTVWPNTLSPEEVSAGARVEYSVRFQNTGTAPAQRVVINDTLSNDLQWASMELIASSHAHTWTIQNGVLYFVFDNIELPDSNSNEAESHGFVKFSMRVATDLMPGESVGNTANIYFDYNEPVITNEAVFSVETNVSVQDVATDALILWPNPVGDQLNMEGAAIGSQVELVDVMGRVLVRTRTTADRTTLDTKGLAAGVYTLRLMHEGASTMRSFVKR